MNMSFADLLRKYYSRKGNRVVFANKMSLNQFAWEMWEKMDYQSIDPSVLSKVLSGKRIFTPKQFKVFCQIIKLSKKDLELLNSVLHLELYKRYDLEESFFQQKSKYFLDLIKDNMKKIEKVHSYDLPELGIEWSEILLERVEEEVKLNKNSAYRKELLKSQADLIIEFSGILICSKTGREIQKQIESSFNKLKNISFEIKNKYVAEYVYWLLGDYFYISSDYQKALKCYYLTKRVSGNIYRPQLRQVALSNAYFNKKEEYEAVKSRILRQLPSVDLDEKIRALEGLARSEARLNLPNEASKYLKLARNLLKKSSVYLQIRNIMIDCAEIELAFLSNSRLDKNYLKRKAEGAILASKEHGYKRHEYKMNNFLKVLRS